MNYINKDNVTCISADGYIQVLSTKIRNELSTSEEIYGSLVSIGSHLSNIIIGNELLEKDNVVTPMGYEYSGYRFIMGHTVVLSTKDDYNVFARGLYNAIQSPKIQGFMDFQGTRGVAALTSPIRTVSFPKLPHGGYTETLIVAKSVIGTGCTAISITKKAVEIYHPKKVVIASIFYSQRGVNELQEEFPNAKIYVVGEPDGLNDDNMLIPGVGNLDERMIAGQ